MLFSRTSRAARTSHPRDVTDISVALSPRLPFRWAAGWAGRRDGTRGMVPDPDTGLTAYLHQLCAVNATMIESERLRTAAHCAPIDQERARLAEQRERARRELELLDDQPTQPADPMARARAHRARGALARSLSEQIASTTEQIAVLDEQRADRVTAGELRIRRCTERTEQLVARYWRAFQRHHPELPDLRAGYGVPAVPIPPHPIHP